MNDVTGTDLLISLVALAGGGLGGIFLVEAILFFRWLRRLRRLQRPAAAASATRYSGLVAGE